MKKNYFKTLFITALIATSTMIGQNVSNVTINGTAGTGATGTEFATPVKTEQGADIMVTFTLTHGTNNIERAFLIVKTGTAAGANIGVAYNNIFDYPGQPSPYTETNAAYPIPSDAALGVHTLRFNGKNYTGADTSGWGTVKDLLIEVVAAGTLTTEKFNNFEFSMYPNPTNKVLTISSKETLKSVEIFNLLGKKVLSSTKNTIDVSSLSSSVYLVKLTSDKGVSTKKLIKN